MTRSMSQQVKLFDDSTNAVMMVTPCDDYFPLVRFDDGEYPSEIDAVRWSRQPHQVSEIDTVSWSRQPN